MDWQGYLASCKKAALVSLVVVGVGVRKGRL